MGDSIFRIATREAIKEMILENAEVGRFGILINEDGLEASANRIVDLFETTLDLRSRTRPPAMVNAGEGYAEAPARANSDFMRMAPSLPKTKNASEIYDLSANKAQKSGGENLPNTPTLNFRLPRKRVALSELEREKLTHS